MIKLIDILNEDVNSAEFNQLHWRDHFKEIIKCAETALSSNDPEIINTEVNNIINHTQGVTDKHEATYSKATYATQFSGTD